MTDSPLFQDGQRRDIKSASLVEFHRKEALEDPDEGNHANFSQAIANNSPNNIIQHYS